MKTPASAQSPAFSAFVAALKSRRAGLIAKFPQALFAAAHAEYMGALDWRDGAWLTRAQGWKAKVQAALA